MSDPTTDPSTPQSSGALSDQPLYISPVVLALDLKDRPTPAPACETCPQALWFRAGDDLKCYCRDMHSLVWEPSLSPVMACDGRELALMRLQSEAEGS
jgi:hypothetical protein